MTYQRDTYTASDESLWHITYDCPPIPSRGADWCAVHDGYDGAPDAGDNRHVYARTKPLVIAEIEAYLHEHSPQGSAFGCGQ